MKTPVQELFGYLESNNLKMFAEQLNQELANTPDVVRIQNVDYAQVREHSLIQTEKQRYYLMFEAIRNKKYDAIQLLLNCGVDLQQTEKIEGIYYEETFDHRVIKHPYSRETATALEKITKLNDLIIVQMVFDHICTRGLYKEAIYRQFLIRHLKDVKLDKFSARFLQIDVGTPLPETFSTIDEYKNTLLELNIDLSDLFFCKRDYFEYLINPQKNATVALLNHALTVCQFEADELQQLCELLPSKELRTCLLDFYPEADPEFAAAFVSYEPVIPLKRPHSLVFSPVMNPVTTADQHDYNHLTEKRIPYLESKVAKLKQITKPTLKERKELKIAEDNLARCKKELKEHPVYSQKDQEPTNKRLDM